MLDKPQYGLGLRSRRRVISTVEAGPAMNPPPTLHRTWQRKHKHLLVVWVCRSWSYTYYASVVLVTRSARHLPSKEV